MHDDFVRIGDDKDKTLPALPAGFEWSKEIWGIRLGEWTGFYRPLNLGLFYTTTEFLGQWLDENGIKADLFDCLLRDRFIIRTGEEMDRIELEGLQKSARRGKFRFICILPTTRCAFQCSYCHQRPKDGIGSTLTSDDFRRCISKCAELCAETPPPIDVLLYGGEPLSAFEMSREIIDTIRRENVFGKTTRLTLTTSGAGLNEARASYLAGNDVFTIVSIDGPAKFNNKVRTGGLDAYETAERALKLLKNHDCRVGLSITIGKHNFENIEECVEYLIKEFQPRDIGLNAFLHWVNGKPNPYQIDAEEAFRAVIQGFTIAQKHGVYAEQPFRRLKPFAYRKPLLKDCSAPGERLVIAPGGAMGFCDSCYPGKKDFYKPEEFPGYESGEYAKWASLSGMEMSVCRECPAMTVCGGACRFDAYSSTGKLDGCDAARGGFERKFLRWMIEEAFKRKHTQDDYYIPTMEDRESIWKNIEIKYENLPFTAGSYSMLNREC